MKDKIQLITMLSLAFLAIVEAKTCNSIAGQLHHAERNAKMFDSVAQYTYDQYKTEHARKEVIESDLKTVKITEARELDEASQRLQVKERQIEGLQKVVAKVKGSFSTKVIHDTVGTVIVEYKDSNLTATARVVNDDVQVDYSINVPIHLTQYWKRPWFLGKKTHYADAYSTNPNAHITNLKSIKISKEPGRFGIGPFFGIGYDLKPTFGISLQYSLIRF